MKSISTMALHFITLSFLFSCASFNNPRQIKEESLDGLRFESLSRYDEIRLKKPMRASSALALCHQGEFKLAYKKFKTQLDKRINDYSYWNQISTCYILEKKYSQAQNFLDLALNSAKTKKQKSVVLNNIGVVHLENKNFHEAKEYFKNSIKLDLKALTPRYNLSQIYLKYGLYENARKEIDLLLSKNPKDVDFLSAKAHLALMQNKFKNALVFFHKIPKQYRSRDDIATNMAMTYFMLGLYTNAKQVINNADKLNNFYLASQLEISKKLAKRVKK